LAFVLCKLFSVYVGYPAVSLPRLYKLFRKAALLFISFVHRTEWNQEMLFPPFFVLWQNLLIWGKSKL